MRRTALGTARWGLTEGKRDDEVGLEKTPFMLLCCVPGGRLRARGILLRDHGDMRYGKCRPSYAWYLLCLIQVMASSEGMMVFNSALQR